MAARVQAHDWAKTPLGPPEKWSQSLKTAVRIMLTSRQPFWVGWGQELTYFYNDAYKSIIGGKHPHALGQPTSVVWREIWHDISPMLTLAMSGSDGTYVESQRLIMERNGYPEETYYTFSYSPIPDDDGKPGGIICANTDDTQRVIGERQVRLLRELATHTTQTRTWKDACEQSARALSTNPFDLPFAIIYIADADGRGLSVAGLSGIAPDHPSAGKLDLDQNALPPVDAFKRSAVVEFDIGVMFKGPAPMGAWPRPPARGIAIPIHAAGETGRAGVLVAGLNPFRLLDDNYRGFLNLIAGQISGSIANARAYEEERQRAEKLAELDRVKTAFFSNVSHEFRTPLTLMLGPLEDLIGSSNGDLKPEAREQLEVIHRNGQRLLRLVNSLLDFSRIEAGRVKAKYRLSELGSLTADIASVFRSAVERAGVRLLIDCPSTSAPAYVDRDMWEKIVLNLISNAFKFTLDGEIAVSVRQKADQIELRIRDTGTGIPEDEMPRLFERFHRVENAKGRTHEGSGIGLALVQELVKLHGGTVSAESVLGKGTTFIVDIPTGSAHLPPEQVSNEGVAGLSIARGNPYVEEALRWLTPEARGAEKIPAKITSSTLSAVASADRPHVLVADDNADMRDYITKLLSDRYRVTAVSDGRAALEAAKKSPPSLVLSDVMMPHLDGFGLLSELRANPELQSIPVILLSARAGEESRVEGIEAGADDYLVKPFSARELLARVGGHIELARVRREAASALRQSQARFKTLVHAAPIGVYVVDSDFRIVEVNPVARPTFGDMPDLLGRDFNEVIHILWPKDFADEIVRLFRETLETGRPHISPEQAGKRRDTGADEYYEWRIDRIPVSENKFGVVCYFRDISNHVLAREALRRSEEALRDADRRKDDFMAMLAHELRNPLGPIRNATEILKKAGALNDAGERSRSIIARQTDHMARLIDDLLDVSRVARGKILLKRATVDLGGLIATVAHDHRSAIDRAGQTLEVKSSGERLTVHGDPTRLAQVFSNLLQNAGKFTPAAGQISIILARDGDKATVSVRDTGSGMSPQLISQLFTPFVQADSTLDRSKGGLGLGLALVKGLIALHGGSVAARSAGRGHGSEFTVTLPLSHQSELPVSHDVEKHSPVRSRKILVIEDNADSAETLKTLLEMNGHHVAMANDGISGVKAFEAFAPDVVLCDIGLPGMNGYEVAKQLRAAGRAGLRLIALTGYGQDDDKALAMNAGFDAHIVKPVNPVAIEQIIA